MSPSPRARSTQKRHLTLAVFPSDDLSASVRKGETRKDYFNPLGLFDHIIIFNPGPAQDLAREPIQFMCGRATFTVISLGANGIRLISHRRAITRRVLQELAETPIDCVRAYGVLGNTAIASLLAQSLRVPFVISLHDNYDEVRRFAWQQHAFGRALFWQYWRGVERKLLASADQVLAVYTYADQYARVMGVPKERIAIIYNRISASFAPTKQSKAAFAQRAKRPLRLLNVMRQVWEKNQEVLVRAVATLPDVELTLIGNGPDHERLIALAQRLGCADRVHFLTSIPNAKLPEQYQHADVFVSSIKQGGIGIPDLEAFCCGIPVIHARSPAERPLDPLFSNAIMVENAPKAFASAIAALRSPVAYERAVRNSFKAASFLRTHDMDLQERQLYERVLRLTPSSKHGARRGSQ